VLASSLSVMSMTDKKNGETRTASLDLDAHLIRDFFRGVSLTSSSR